jgi:hypothetical protein
MAERISVIDDSVLELVGELYVHEDEDFKARVTFADYLKIALRAYPEGAVRADDLAPRYHAHQCHCGTWVTCERPALPADACAAQPSCRYHRQRAAGPLLLVEEA